MRVLSLLLKLEKQIPYKKRRERGYYPRIGWRNTIAKTSRAEKCIRMRWRSERRKRPSAAAGWLIGKWENLPFLLPSSESDEFALFLPGTSLVLSITKDSSIESNDQFSVLILLIFKKKAHKIFVLKYYVLQSKNFFLFFFLFFFSILNVVWNLDSPTCTCFSFWIFRSLVLGFQPHLLF